MADHPTLLKALLRERHWQKYATFCKEYDKAAQRIDPSLAGSWPSRGQFARWLAGSLRGLPHPDACRVLESMFPNRTAAQLFYPTPQDAVPAAPGGAAYSANQTHPAGPGHPGGDTDPGDMVTVSRQVETGVPLASTSTFTPMGTVTPTSGYPPAGGAGPPIGFAGPAEPAASAFAPVIPTVRVTSDYDVLRPPVPVPPRVASPTGVSGEQMRTYGWGAPTTDATRQVPSEDNGRVAHDRPVGALSEVIKMAAEEAARFVRRSRGAVDQDVLDQLTADVRHLATDYLTRAPYELFRPLARLRHDVFDMLEDRQRPKVLPSLYRVGGQLCALLALASSDMGQPYAAETDTRAAWLCAELAEDDLLRAYVRWIQSNVAYWTGDYRHAAELARSGQKYATSGTSLLRLASQEARAWAACHDAREVERALANVARARELAESTVDEPGVFRFEPGKAAYYASEVCLSLGGEDNFRRAETHAIEALDLFSAVAENERCPEFVAAAQLDLVASHLAMGDLEGTDEHLRPVLRLPVESRTLPIVQRIGKAQTAIGGRRFANTALADDMSEQIDLFCTYTARRETPELPR